MIRFGLKLGIAAGATYYTVDKGVWKDSDTTTAIYEEIVQNVRPYIKEANEQSPFKVDDIPTPTDALSAVPIYWNKAVNKSCLFIWQLPNYAVDTSKNAYSYIANNQELKNFFAGSSEPVKQSD